MGKTSRSCKSKTMTRYFSKFARLLKWWFDWVKCRPHPHSPPGRGWQRREGGPGTWRAGRPRCWGRSGRRASPGGRSRWGRRRGRGPAWPGHRWPDFLLTSRRFLKGLWCHHLAVVWLWANIYLTERQEIILTAGPTVAMKWFSVRKILF